MISCGIKMNNPYISFLREKEEKKNKTVSSLLEEVEIEFPSAFVRLHELADNRYWVGYLRRGEELIKDLNEQLKVNTKENILLPNECPKCNHNTYKVTKINDEIFCFYCANRLG